MTAGGNYTGFWGKYVSVSDSCVFLMENICTLRRLLPSVTFKILTAQQFFKVKKRNNTVKVPSRKTDSFYTEIYMTLNLV